MQKRLLLLSSCQLYIYKINATDKKTLALHLNRI